MKKMILTYSEYLDSLSNEEIERILNFFNIKHRKNSKKENLIKILINSAEDITKYSFNLFQSDELTNLKLVLKSNGHIKPRTNYLLLYFLNNLNKKGMVKKVDEDEFYMPKDIQKYFKSYLKDKDSLKIIKSNTKEYNLIMGLLNTYGVLSYDKFYEMFNNIISCDKEYLFDRLTILNNFYGEFELYFSKKEKYVCNKAILKEKGIQLKDIKKYVNKKSDYKTFSSKELTSMFSYKYMSKFKSFKKMLSFVKKNYYLDEKDIRVFYKYVIIPYLNDVQIDNPTKEDNLSKNIDKYFEYKNEKHKNKFMDLVKGIINEAPMWKYNGYSEIEKEKGIV